MPFVFEGVDTGAGRFAVACPMNAGARFLPDNTRDDDE